ncbi:MAG: hypothetical protein LC637_00905 [Xanthomonadaceae bacterium]|nr:hypothetical protein [Xanthomonadaceae bacterium]
MLNPLQAIESAGYFPLRRVKHGPGTHHVQVETLSGLKQPATPVTAELQQKLTPMAALRELPDLVRDEVTIGAPLVANRPSHATWRE